MSAKLPVHLAVLCAAADELLPKGREGGREGGKDGCAVHA